MCRVPLQSKWVLWSTIYGDHFLYVLMLAINFSKNAFICSKELLLILCSVSVTQLQSSVERPCPGDRVTFTCTVPSLGHQWRVPSFDIAQSLLPGDQGQVFSDPPFQFAVTEVRIGTSITSTATVNVTANLNGTLFVCQDGIGMLPDQSITINLQGEHGIMYW